MSRVQKILLNNTEQMINQNTCQKSIEHIADQGYNEGCSHGNQITAKTNIFGEHGKFNPHKKHHCTD